MTRDYRTQVRISAELMRIIKDDLKRPHSYAFERIGFCTARLAAGTSPNPYVILTGYWGVADNDYVKDGHVGARIASNAITIASTTCLQQSYGIFHVHTHPGSMVRPSSTDRIEIPRMIETFRILQPALPHGFVILGEESAYCEIWMPGGQSSHKRTRFSIVGRPLRIFES